MPESAELSLPRIELELLEDLSPKEQRGFLRLLRGRYQATYPDGTRRQFVYDVVDRDALDAVVIAAHFVAPGGARRIFLRSALRPPLTMRGSARLPLLNEARHGRLWELPAGLLEVSEQSEAGLVRCAQRELLEELGFEVELARLHALGHSTFPVPGFIAERQFFFEVEVDPSTRREPELDGSALEHFGSVVDLDLSRALELCRSGAIEDAKTELALRRLLEKLG